jgi:molybdopterin converting factor subunit 1
LRVDIRLFAGYRERVGKRALAMDLPDGATVGRLADEMVQRYPGLIVEPRRLVVAVNEEYRDHQHALSDGDEVALIPPVSGG